MAPMTLLSPLSALLLAPLLLGIINRTKAVFAGRKGQPLLQPYYTIIKLLRKSAVYSATTTWLFRAGPIVTLAALITASFMLPLGNLGAPVSFSGDVLLFIYLLALGRFFTVVAALDTGSAFEGMGASREVFFSAIAEPVLLLGILALCKHTHSFSLSGITGALSGFSLVPSLLIGAALFLVLLAENARIPVDDPNTHLELTMIHEVMVLDHSGPDFAYISYGVALKLWLFSIIVVRTLMPIHIANTAIDLLVTLLGSGVLAIAVGVVESVMARFRLTRVPLLMAAAFALAALALFFESGIIA
jgi:formate hydrogenlyase subunit 4